MAVGDDAKGLFCCSAPCGGNTGLSSTGDVEDQDSVLDSCFIETGVLLRLVVDERGEFADALLLVDAPLVEFGLLLSLGSLAFSALRHLALRF